MVTNLALLELLFYLEMKDDIAWDALDGDMEKQDINMPTTFEPIELCAMSDKNKSNARKNINDAGDDLFCHMDGNFVLNQDELLHMWQANASGYTTACHVKAENFELNEDSRRDQLLLQARYLLRYINLKFNQIS